MAGLKIGVHVQYVPDFGPADKFVPPTLQVQENADAGGGKPTVPNALVFVEPDGETHVYVVSEQMRQQILRILTGGVIVAKPGDVGGQS